MGKNAQIMRMNYKGLCKFFNEDEKKSNERNKQFARWEKDYCITRLEGTYEYSVREKTIAEKGRSEGYTDSYMPYLRKVMYNHLMKKPEWEITLGELILDLRLANENFFNNNNFYIYNLLEKYGISKNDLRTCKYEIWKFTSRAIRQVLNEMQKDKIIINREMFRVTPFESDNVLGKPFLVEKDKEGDIMKLRNKYAKEWFWSIYEMLDGEDKIIVDNEVNIQLGYAKIESVYVITVDCETLNFCLQDPSKYLISKNDEKSIARIMNDLQQVKFLKSKQGGLKSINQSTKLDINDNIIKK